MKFEKQDVGVWVKASIMPEESGFYLAKRIDDSVSKMHFDRQREVWVNYRGNVVEWLKPLKDVFLLTKDELLRLIKDAMLWIDDTAGSINDNAERFLESIKQ